MARVLLAWEAGDGLGHVGRLLPVAHALRVRGHEVVFAVRRLVPCATVLADWPVLQAPYVEPKVSREGPTGSFADLLAVLGFDALDRLLPIVRAWRELMVRIGVHAVVADYSPVLCLASRGVAPMILLGDGFTLPPSEGAAFPRYIPDRPPRHDESQLLGVANEALGRLGAPELPRLPALLGDCERFVVVLPELDLFSPDRRAERLIGPLSPLPAPDETTPARDYFAYLSATARNVGVLLDALALSGATGSVYLRDASARELDAARGRGLHVHDRPRDLVVAAAEARVLVHHGGLGTTEVGLALGRPQLLAPRHLEQGLTAAALRRWRVGATLAVNGRYGADDALAGLRHVLSSDELSANARRVAANIAARRPSVADNVALVSERIAVLANA